MEYKKKVTTLDVVTKKTNKSLPEQPIEDGIRTAELEIPFHAIDHVDVTSELQTVTRPDPYGCERGDEPKTMTLRYGVDFTCPGHALPLVKQAYELLENNKEVNEFGEWTSTAVTILENDAVYADNANKNGDDWRFVNEYDDYTDFTPSGDVHCGSFG